VAETGGESYPLAPIFEAVLRYEFDELAESDVIQMFMELHVSEKAGFEERAQTVNIEPQLSPGENGAPEFRPTLTVVGHAARFSDRSREISISKNVMEFTRRGTYSSWGEFTDEALQWVALVVEYFKPKALNTVTTDFMNRIPIPDRPIEMSDYVRISVDVPVGLSRTLNSSHSQIVVPLEGGLETTITVFTTTDDENRLYPGIGLTTSTRMSLFIPALDSDGLRSGMAHLQRAKNDVFEACITDATRMLIRGGIK
jgi:uncharacterized protein (TIGR04255 family)